MRKKLYTALNKIYGVMMTVSFFAGILPVLPFLFALIVGGPTAEAVTVFFYKQYYPWVIVIGCLAILVGLAAMYAGKLEGLSVKKINGEKGEKK